MGPWDARTSVSPGHSRPCALPHLPSWHRHSAACSPPGTTRSEGRSTHLWRHAARGSAAQDGFNHRFVWDEQITWTKNKHVRSKWWEFINSWVMVGPTTFAMLYYDETVACPGDINTGGVSNRAHLESSFSRTFAKCGRLRFEGQSAEGGVRWSTAGQLGWWNSQMEKLWKTHVLSNQPMVPWLFFWGRSSMHYGGIGVYSNSLVVASCLAFGAPEFQK